ncbi:hypothetical protein E4U19_008161 [Claviceps sp. Clav32 group G5]|nr:hypothetical protein E4U19_008161 [Claviceps sp. Clav32 group G5]KAG6031227.1 hypothetical protein E4U40_007320 [Claviceps sp. LM458 group G5]KAG6048864.1 hypothetical protein E4U39_006845 [Claviceps sp. Clav50 group G5]
MAPSFLKQLRRRSRASFRTDTSTDASSDGTNSQGTSPSSGSVTPPSVGHQSDPALDFQIKSSGSLRKIPKRTVSQSRPALSSVCSNSSNSRTSVSGMSGLGAPPVSGRDTASLSQYAPRYIRPSLAASVVLRCHGWLYPTSARPYSNMAPPASTWCSPLSTRC